MPRTSNNHYGIVLGMPVPTQDDNCWRGCIKIPVCCMGVNVCQRKLQAPYMTFDEAQATAINLTNYTRSPLHVFKWWQYSLEQNEKYLVEINPFGFGLNSSKVCTFDNLTSVQHNSTIARTFLSQLMFLRTGYMMMWEPLKISVKQKKEVGFVDQIIDRGSKGQPSTSSCMFVLPVLFAALPLVHESCATLIMFLFFFCLTSCQALALHNVVVLGAPLKIAEAL